MAAPGTQERVVTLVEDLERILLEFIRRHTVTHEEYRAATNLIIDEIRAGEESLLFDVFLEAEATDVGNTLHGGSMEAIEGPFYLPGAPVLDGPSPVMPQRPDEAGTPLVFHGTITADGAPMDGVELDMWHADADGLYSQIHPGLPEWNLRGRFRSGQDGTFSITTVLPPPYEIPKEGPTGTVLNALGRHFWRPAHLHVKLRSPGHRPITSQLYFRGGDYMDDDVANAVRDGLVLDLVQHGAPGAAGSHLEARYDFEMTTDRG